MVTYEGKDFNVIGISIQGLDWEQRNIQKWEEAVGFSEGGRF